MSRPEPPAVAGLSERLVRWMAAHRDRLDALMEQEGSRAVHEEFLMAEGGALPDRRARLDRARGASARAWLRHLAVGLAEEWDGAPPALAAALEDSLRRGGERLEALMLEEAAALERHGLSGDPGADRRDAELTAHCRLFAEGVGAARTPGGDGGPDFGRRVAAAARRRGARLRALEREAREAWGGAAAPGRRGAAGAPDPLRVAEAAAVWAHVRVLTEALEATLAEGPAT